MPRTIKRHPERVNCPPSSSIALFSWETTSLPSVAAQAALTVIGRRVRFFRSGEEERLDFIDAHLPGARLWETRLEGAVFIDAHLEGASLRGAHLEEADLSFAHLNGAFLDDAHLVGAFLRAVDLTDACLVGTDLGGVDLRETHGLTQGQIAVARTDAATQLPDYL